MGDVWILEKLIGLNVIMCDLIRRNGVWGFRGLKSLI